MFQCFPISPSIITCPAIVPSVDDVGHDSRPDYPDDKQESVGTQRAWHNRMECNLAQVRFDDYQLVEYANDENAREKHEKLLYYVESSCHHRHQKKDIECAENCSVQKRYTKEYVKSHDSAQVFRKVGRRRRRLSSEPVGDHKLLPPQRLPYHFW